jgi:hypothetical protein
MTLKVTMGGGGPAVATCGQQRSGGDDITSRVVEDLRWAGVGGGGEQWKKRFGRVGRYDRGGRRGCDTPGF